MVSKTTEYKKLSEASINSQESRNSKEDHLSFAHKVDKSCEEPLFVIFETLLLKKGRKQQDLADFLGVDKSYVSRMVHGLQIPPLRVRIIVAKFFNTDSSLIWRTPEILTADKLEESK